MLAAGSPHYNWEELLKEARVEGLRLHEVMKHY
jgi:hypothetical protein